MFRWLLKPFVPLSPEDAAVNLVCALLTEGKGWEVDAHYARHQETQINLWIANKDYGFGLSIGGRGASPGQAPWGGELSDAHKKKLWIAYQKMGAETQACAVLETLLNRVNAMKGNTYGNQPLASDPASRLGLGSEEYPKRGPSGRYFSDAVTGRPRY